MRCDFEQSPNINKRPESGSVVRMCSSGSFAASQWGFTLAEMIAVIVIVGILSVAVLPRFFDRNTFESRGFYDQALSGLRYAQKTAIAQHRFVCVTFSPGSITLTYDPVSPSATHGAAACNSNLTSPAGQTPYVITAPNGVTLSGYANFNFDALGRPSPNAKQTISVLGQTAAIIIEAETGYVH
jgi:MSHA pilin protein MshC